jgi:hypothetical protein
MLIGSTKHCRLTNQILAFALPIISIIIFRKLQNVMKNSDHTTILPEWLVEMTEFVNMASARAHFRSSIDLRTRIVCVVGNIANVPMNRMKRRLAGNFCISFNMQ